LEAVEGIVMKLPTLQTHKQDVDTPALCLDLDVIEKNLHAMAEACRERGIDWRPHAKCHKSPLIAQKLIDAGAIGVTCAKLGEAEVMGAGGIQDILIANLIVGPQKVARLVELRRIANPVVCVDHVSQVKAFSEAFAASGLQLRVMIEVDIGLKRVGVAPGAATVELAKQIAAAPGLEFAGIMGYEGHLLCIEDQAEKATRIRETLSILTDTAEQLAAAGLPCKIVSCGGTGSFKFSINQPGITEVQAGGGVFMDAFYRHRCQVTEWDFGLTVLATIVSRPAPDRAVIDAGRKTMDANLQMPFVLRRDDIRVVSLSAEHGVLHLEPSAQDLQIGDRLEIVPGYSDMTCVMHDHFLAFRDGQLEAIWPLVGRGRLQ
jgi:D-serine deaminase-like pyridoxal phosphate-dependent protein